MEFAVFPLLEQKKFIKYGIIHDLSREVQKAFDQRVPFGDYRIYLGSESCERLIPTEKNILQNINLAKKNKLKISLVTPIVVTSAGIKQLRRLFSLLNDFFAVKFEVIINDWGVLNLIQEYDNLIPVIGRNLNKMRRDVQVKTEEIFNEIETPKKSSLTNELYLNFLKRRRVRAFEFDNLWVGIKMNFKEHAVHSHLYLPLLPISYTGTCIFASTSKKEPEKFIVGTPCSRECLDYYIINFAPFSQQQQRTDLAVCGRGIYGCNTSIKNIRLKDFDRIIYVFVRG